MELLTYIKMKILYFLLAVPLALVAYESFMAIAVGNRAWTFLVVGQLILVPVTAYLFAFVFGLLVNTSEWVASLAFLTLLAVIIALSVSLLTQYYGTVEKALV